MRAITVQPAYGYKAEEADRLFDFYINTLESFGKDADIIVLPEYSDIPAKVGGREELLSMYEKYGEKLYNKAKETAKRCNAHIFLGGVYEYKGKLRNSVVCFDRQGNEAGRYFKQHLVPREMDSYCLDKNYTYEFSQPEIIEIDGIKYAFMICYDCYFYEMLSNIARFDPDVFIISAYQRSDTHETLATLTKFAAYNTNTYVIRSSVSLGADSPTGGSSMIVSPEGIILADAENRVGYVSADIDPHKRFLKPAGYGNPDAPHHKYIEDGRRPWKYRPGGPFIVSDNKSMPYPRFCAHRGFNTIAPENSLPAFGAAIALGAEEIEFDLWGTADGEIVSIHDPVLDRVSDGKGYVFEKTLAELYEYDFGSVYDEKFRGLKIPAFEDILKKFSCQVIMNVHIKHTDDVSPIKEEILLKIINLIKKYDCEKYVYFMSGNPAILKQLERLAPEIERCAGADEDPKTDLADKAIACGCSKIQLFSPHFQYNDPDYAEKTIEKAHKYGIKVNLFYTDSMEEAEKYLKMGVDCILTNDYHRVSGKL